jgi:hypothetical protein
MSFKANDAKPAGGSRPKAAVLESGMYPGRLISLIDLGLQASEYDGKPKEPRQRMMTTYELADEFMVDEDGEEDTSLPRWISEELPMYQLDAEKAKSTARYLGLDPKNEHDSDWEMLLGMPCMIHLVSKVSNKGNEYNQVSGVARMRDKEAVKAPESINEPFIFDLDTATKEDWEKVPQWIQKKITEGLEWSSHPLSGVVKAEGEVKAATKSEETEEDDDDVPY